MGATTKAVFLSYASQDADAVRRIAEALRAGGIEAWFDQAELRGGDAWDQKIRRQIKDCTLFLPVISAATQARGEGYFRREWKLAVERTMDMADGVPFLFPIVLDGVTDRDALVPEVFRQVQWTRVGSDGLPPAFVTNIAELLGSRAAPGGAGPAATPAGPPARASASAGLPRWATGFIVAASVGTGLFFAINGALRRGERSAPRPEAKAPAKPEPAKAALAAEAAALDPRKIALSRFENLTGDASLDAVARLLESELIRGLGGVANTRLVPVEGAGRKAGREAAREAGAASVIVGSFVRQGDRLEINAEVVLTKEGEIFGSVGPATVLPTALRGPELAELVDRLATGVNNVAATLLYPPTRLAAVIYSRPWPRWSVGQQLTAARNTLSDDPVALIKRYQEILAQSPELLKGKHDLARLLRDTGRLDEAQQLFRELLGQDRGRLAEAEIYAIVYDEALLAGDPDRAIQAARALVEIRPVSDAITQVLSCLWAQNRPMAAYEEIAAWWERHGQELPEASRAQTEAGVYATKASAQIQMADAEGALATVAQLKKVLGTRQFPSMHWLEFTALGLLGREQAQIAMLQELAAQSGSSRIEPVSYQWSGYCLALHRGRREEAARWLAAADRSWSELMATGRLPEGLENTGIWLNEARGRLPEANQALDVLAKKFPGHVSVVGARAVLLLAEGRKEEARVLERQLEQWDARNGRGLPAYWRARLAARAGDKERATSLLRQAVAGGLWFGGFQSPTFNFGRLEPEFSSLMGYEPYEQLLRPKG